MDLNSDALLPVPPQVLGLKARATDDLKYFNDRDNNRDGNNYPSLAPQPAIAPGLSQES